MIFSRMAESHGLMERLEKAVTRLESLFSDSHRAGGMECDAVNGVNGSKSGFMKYHLSLMKKIASRSLHLSHELPSAEGQKVFYPRGVNENTCTELEVKWKTQFTEVTKNTKDRKA